MSRKNTILIAVTINIGLLAMLFFVASKQKEETLPIDPTGFLVEDEMLDTAITQENENQLGGKSEPQIVHVLPEVIEEKTDPIADDKSVVSKESGSDLKVINVVKGDSLDKIAKAYNVSVDDIVEINQLKTTIIRIGQSLKIPYLSGSARNKVEKPIIKREYYTVKPGDNPWTISMKYNIKVEDLLKLNDLNKEKAKKLRPGDKLRIR